MLRRTAESQRAKAADQRALAARMREEAGRSRKSLPSEVGGVPIRSGTGDGGRVQYEREPDADERDGIADYREVEADERERIADEREIDADQRETAADDRELGLQQREDRLTQLNAAAINREMVAKQARSDLDLQLDDRERVLGLREADLDERDRIFQQDQISEELVRSVERMDLGGGDDDSLAVLLDRGAALRVRGADLACRMADQADEFAGYVEVTTAVGDQELRLSLAKAERDFAKAERDFAKAERENARERRSRDTFGSPYEGRPLSE